MKYTCLSGKPREIKTDCLLYLVPEFEKLTPNLKGLDHASGGVLSSLLESKAFTGKSGQNTVVRYPEGFAAEKIILMGLGSRQKLTADSFRQACGTASRLKELCSCRQAAVYSERFSRPEFIQAAAEGYLLGGFKLLEFKSEPDNDEPRLESISFIVDDKKSVRKSQAAAERGQVIAEGQILARRLAATPPNFLTPTIFADRARELARKYKFGCRVLDETKIAAEKMGALLAVSLGSDQPARFIIMEHKGGRASTKPVVLIGKGVTFDSGGISLKPGLNMHEMKQDMSGAAAVLATMVTAARLSLPVNVIGLIPATENLPSGGAVKPGDVITSRKGLTIEIINTDAEGRLILADALDFANKFKPQAVIDIATLTGAAVYILGYAGAPILGNNKRLMEAIKSASAATAERVWELPIWDDFREAMKSTIADLQNSAGKTAGTACAAAFLENFIGDWPWGHIDMAYMDMEVKGQPYIPKGAAGYGVRLLVELLSRWKKV